jgi:outer membrane protein OmpA-like peptidoglycan-associated protein
MRKYIITAVALVMAIPMLAQSLKLQRADIKYNNLAFSEAIGLYRDVITKEPGNTYAAFKLANCYRQVNNPEQAVAWFEKALPTGTGEPINYLYYAQALRQVGRYEDAVKAYENFLKWYPEDKRGTKGIEASRNAQLLLKRPSLFGTGNVAFNSEFAEFSPAFAPNGLTFTSDRTSRMKIDYIYPWTGTPYLDSYIVKNDGQGGLNSPDLLREDMNSAYHDGNATFAPGGKLMAFTRSQYVPGLITGKSFKSELDGVVKLKIMFATYNDQAGKWNDPFDATFNNSQYSFAHPSFSADGRTLFFTSDMPGGYGGTDIWKVKIRDDMSTERPDNMGPAINTAGEEMFPVADKANNLYFASNNHPGLGGLDIFRARFDSNSDVYKSVFNLGTPVNSSRDDFGLILNIDNNTGYFASNRPGGKGSDDIYTARLDGIFYEVEVFDAGTLKILPGVNVTITDKNGVSFSSVTNRDGMFFYPLETNSNYKLDFRTPLYNDAETMVYTTEVPPGTTLEDRVGLVCSLGSVIRGLVLEEKSMLPLREATVTLKNVLTGEEQTIITDKSGSYTMTICPDIDYIITASKAGYKDDVYNFSTKGMTERTDKLQNLILRGGEFICNIEFNNIYFDLDKADLRPDASSDLEVMYTILSGSPTVRVEVGAHTDSRASNGYNLELSRRRARAVVDYLTKRGIDRSRIVSKGYGESELKNNCSDGVTCTEEEHQENRRVEFRLIDEKNKVLCKSKAK